MKRIILFIIMIIISSSIVLGANVYDNQGKEISNNLKYLEQAQIQVKSQLKSQELIQNLENFQLMNQNKLYDCDNECKITIESSLGLKDTNVITIKRKAKFLWLDVDLFVEYETENNGEIVQQKTNIWQKLYQFRIVG